MPNFYTLEQLLSESGVLGDNNSGQISAADLRDAIYSVYTISSVTYSIGTASNAELSLITNPIGSLSSGSVQDALEYLYNNDNEYYADSGLILIGNTFSTNSSVIDITDTVGGLTSGTIQDALEYLANITDNDTTYTAGDGIILIGNTFSTNSSVINITNTVGGLTSGSVQDALESLSNDINNITDNDTTYTAGEGITLTGTTFSTDSDTINITNAVGGLTSGSVQDALESLSNDINNITDNDTTYTAGEGVTLTGTTFSTNLQTLLDNDPNANINTDINIQFGSSINGILKSGTGSVDRVVLGQGDDPYSDSPSERYRGYLSYNQGNNEKALLLSSELGVTRYSSIESMYNNSSSEYESRIVLFDGSNGWSMRVRENVATTINDSIHNTGLLYNSDYSSIGSTNSNWIPNWGFVENYINDNFTATQSLELELLALEKLQAPTADYSEAELLNNGIEYAIEPLVSGSGWISQILDFTVSGLPNGITLSTASETFGYLLGTPTSDSTGTAIITGENIAGSFSYSLNWTVTSEALDAPSATWDLSALEQDVEAFVLPITSGYGWTQQEVTISIVSGSLPTGLSIVTSTEDESWSAITGTPTVTSSGSVTIRTEHVTLGFVDNVINWTVAPPDTGANTYLNVVDRYPELFVEENDFNGLTFSKVDGVMGQIDDTYAFDTSATMSQVYHYDYLGTSSEGFSHAYLMQHGTSSFWYIFQSDTAPASLVNGLDLADGLGPSAFEITTASDSEQITFDSVDYPVSSLLHYKSTSNYLNFGQEALLSRFLSSNYPWSFGFRAAEDIPEDFLGRPLFGRDGGNYIGFKSYNSTHGYIFTGVGSGATDFALDSVDITTISSGQWVIGTYDGTESFRLYINGTQVAQYSVGGTFESDFVGTFKDLWFGKSPKSNVDQGVNNTETFHTYWQGLIADLFIVNNSALGGGAIVEINGQSDITASSNYSSITHAWRLDETTGNTFTALKGGININGNKD